MEKTEPRGVLDGVGATDRIQLVEELADVELGRVHRDAEPPGDHLVGRALGDQRQHLDFARGQRLIGFGMVVAGFVADRDDVGSLSRRGETDMRHAGQDRRQPVGEIGIVFNETRKWPKRLRAFFEVTNAALRWPSIAPTVARLNAEMTDRLADQIRAAQASGDIRTGLDATAEAVAITGAMRGIMGQWLIAPDSVGFDAARDNFIAGLRRSRMA
jgi:transcriptional regulator BetI-like protein